MKYETYGGTVARVANVRYRAKLTVPLSGRPTHNSKLGDRITLVTSCLSRWLVVAAK